jgi:hypothetical protein
MKVNISYNAGTETIEGVSRVEQIELFDGKESGLRVHFSDERESEDYINGSVIELTE